MSGGQVLNTYEVDNYLGLPGINGFDMGMKFREHAEKCRRNSWKRMCLAWRIPRIASW